MKKHIIIFLISAIALTGCINRSVDIAKAAEVTDNLYRIGGQYSIADGFDAYYNLRDKNMEKIPLLLHLKVKYKETNSKVISDSIEDMYISIAGIDEETELNKSYDDESCYSTIVFIKSKSDEIYEPIENEAEIAFLKEKFEDRVKIKSVNESIKYEVENQVDNYIFVIRITRNQMTNELKLVVEDKGNIIELK